MRPILPSKIQILNVALGGRGSADGGRYANGVHASVNVHIVGANSGVFRVVQVETDDVVTDVGQHGHIIQTLQTALVVKASEPIEVFGDQAILVPIEFSCPSDPAQGAFRATAVMDGLPAPNGISILATARLGTVVMDNLTSPTIRPGQKENYDFQIISSLGHDVHVAVEYDSVFEPHFSAPTQSPLFIPKEAIVPLTIPITCAPGTPVGNHSLHFNLRNLDRPEVFGGGGLAITVTRSVMVVTTHCRTDIAQKAAETARLLGAPASDIQDIMAPDALEPSAQRFQFGTVYCSLGTGAHEVNGEINALYDSLGGPQALADQIGLFSLGLPITDEKVALDGVGRVSDFENGSIYWHPRTGPVANHDVIKAAYGPTWCEAGPLGYPSLDTHSWHRIDAQARLVWGLFENGCIASNFTAPPVVVAGLENTAEIPADTLKTMVRHAIDKKIHKSDTNVGLDPGIDSIGVSDWQHGFGSSGRRIITFRLSGFKDMGAILPDVNFKFFVPLQFGWADDPFAFVDGGSRSLIAQVVGNIHVSNISVTSIPELQLVNVLTDILAPRPSTPTDEFRVTDVPVQVTINGDPVRTILEMLVTPEGSMRFFCNPFSPLGGSFGTTVQSKINDAVTNFLDS